MEDTSSPPQRQQPNWRSTASNNWRVKDDSPRVEQPQQRNRFDRNQNGGERQGYNNQSYSRNNQSNQDSSDNSEAAPGTRLYVGNLLYTAQKPDVEELFRNHGYNVVSISMSTDPFTGRNPSYCFVDLDSADEAQRAMAEMSGVDLHGRPLRVSVEGI
jgi:RNA recognition motif-containing protein